MTARQTAIRAGVVAGVGLVAACLAWAGVEVPPVVRDYAVEFGVAAAPIALAYVAYRLKRRPPTKTDTAVDQPKQPDSAAR